ncbi:hypothetical protein V8H18_10375 [Lautropia mirabilis]
MTLRRRIISVLVAHAAAFGAISAQAAVEPSELVGPIAEYKLFVDKNVSATGEGHQGLRGCRQGRPDRKGQEAVRPRAHPL